MFLILFDRLSDFVELVRLSKLYVFTLSVSSVAEVNGFFDDKTIVGSFPLLFVTCVEIGIGIFDVIGLIVPFVCLIGDIDGEMIGSASVDADRNGLVDGTDVGVVATVDGIVVGDIFKNGFVDFLSDVSVLLNSALNIFIDGTLIFSIVPRSSE